MMGQPGDLPSVVAADAHASETLYMDVLATLPHVRQLASQLEMKVVKRSTELPR